MSLDRDAFFEAKEDLADNSELSTAEQEFFAPTPSLSLSLNQIDEIIEENWRIFNFVPYAHEPKCECGGQTGVTILRGKAYPTTFHIDKCIYGLPAECRYEWKNTSASEKNNKGNHYCTKPEGHKDTHECCCHQTHEN